jgi:hypothetical protein
MKLSRSPAGRARGLRPGPWWRRVRLRDVLFATVPLFGLGAWLFGSACLDYYRIRQFDDWWTATKSVRKFGMLRLRAALNAPRASMLREQIPAEDPERETLRLLVDSVEFDALSRDAAGHWGQWIDAIAMRGDHEIPCEFRFRGDASAHWTAEKKSFSIKTGKDEFYCGFQRLDFTLKDVLPQYLANSLAKDFELLVPETAVLPVYVNGLYYGIFRCIESVDEAFLRRNGRMPGNIFRGDAAMRGEYFKNLPRELFINPTPWERVAANERPGAPERWGIHQLLEDLIGSTIDDHARFMARLDRAELERLLALMLIVADPYHMSGIHNQLWYEDPASGTLHPIVWDLRLVGWHHPPPGSNWNRLWRALLRDPRLLDEALSRVAAMLDGGLVERARELVEESYGAYRDHFQYEHLRWGVIHPVGNADACMDLLGRNIAVLRSWMQDARVAERIVRLDQDTWLLDVRSLGRAAAVLEGLEADTLEPVELYADVDRDGALGAGDRALGLVRTPAGLELETAERLPAACTTLKAELLAQPLDYRFLVVAPGAQELRARYANGHSGAALEPEELPAGTALASTGWHPWDLAALELPSARAVELSGRVRLDQDLVIEPGERLVIAPGTELELAPFVSVLVKGRLDAQGTPAARIAVRNADPALPFGVFALQGPGASGSRLAHVDFRGGGGGLLERVEYQGAVSVHQAQDVAFEHCTFADNLRCDDLLSVVQGDVDLSACRFERANADSVDYDLSTGDLIDCEVQGSVDDGFDLMACSPRIVRARIRGSGDKGLSIGAGAAPCVIDTEIEDCPLGIEIADGSAPDIVTSRISGCDVGVLARRKDRNYPTAGRGRLLGTELRGNRADFELLDGAMLALHGEPLAETPLAELDIAHDFLVPRAGWRGLGGARRVDVVDGELLADFRDFEGAVGHELGWRVPDGGSGHIVLVNAAGTGIAAARVGLALAGAAPLEVPLVLDEDPERFRLTAIPVPAGVIDAIAIAVEPDLAGATLLVREVVLLPMAAGSP